LDWLQFGFWSLFLDQRRLRRAFSRDTNDSELRDILILTFIGPIAAMEHAFRSKLNTAPRAGAIVPAWIHPPTRDVRKIRSRDHKQETAMIQQIHVQEDNIVAFRLSGKLSHADYQAFLPRLEELIKAHGRISVLLELADFHGWDLDAARDDFRFGMRHQDDFERIAIVGRGALQHWMALMAKPFTSAGVRFFKQDQLGEAWDWLREPLQQAALDQAPPAPYQRILVGVDFSPHSVRAVRRALDLAHRYGGRVNLVHAVENPVYYDQDYGPVAALDIDLELMEAAKGRMQQLIGELDAGDLPSDVLFGSPKGVILSQAEALHGDLIVVGTHGHRGIARLLGSTANAVSHNARCDVLTVHIDATE
jgi:universal stress protein A